jgi:hypothetical protein
MNSVVAPENDGHPPPLEVERHLVDLLESCLDLDASLELEMLQDRDVEQVLEVGLAASRRTRSRSGSARRGEIKSPTRRAIRSSANSSAARLTR